MSQSRLFAKLLENEITDAERGQLNQLLRDDPELRRLYRKYMTLDAMLRWEIAPPLMRVTEEEREAVDSPAGGIILESGVSIPSIVVDSSPAGFTFVGSMAFSYMVASVVLCAMLLSAWAYRVADQSTQPDRVIKNGPVGKEMEFVARVTAAVDCKWDDPNKGTLAGAWVTVGRKYALVSGLMEIAYMSGARVILEGPCIYRVDSRTGGHLSFGKLTARVEKKKPHVVHPSSFRPHPSALFSVTTPTAVVTDLGTEFGVEVDASGNTTSHVFQGLVKFEAIGGSPKSVMLRKDETASARIGPAGVSVFTAVPSPKFIRKTPRSTVTNHPVFGKASVDFTWKYEMDVDPVTQDLDANPGPDWDRRRGAVRVNGDGTVTLDFAEDASGSLITAGLGDSARSPGHVWNSITPETGYTVELRVKVVGTVEWHGHRLGLYFAAADSIAEKASVLAITDNGTLWDFTSKYQADNNRNDDDFHVFRIAQEPNGGKYQVWRDGVLIRLSEGFQDTGWNRVQFGDMGTGGGPIVVDYVRVTAGAFAPPKNALPDSSSLKDENRKEGPL